MIGNAYIEFKGCFGKSVNPNRDIEIMLLGKPIDT